MRKLLFKGKRTDNGEWIVANSIYYPKSEDSREGCYLKGTENSTSKWIPIIPETVSEFIGLKDMADNIIFENDRIETADGRIKGVIRYGEYKQAPFTVQPECKNQGFYIDWIDDGVNCWNEWLRQDILFWKDKINVVAEYLST